MRLNTNLRKPQVNAELFQRLTLNLRDHLVDAARLRRRNHAKARIRRALHHHGRPDGPTGAQRRTHELGDMRRGTKIDFPLSSYFVVYPPCEFDCRIPPTHLRFHPTTSDSKYFACDPRIYRHVFFSLSVNCFCVYYAFSLPPEFAQPLFAI